LFTDTWASFYLTSRFVISSRFVFFITHSHTRVNWHARCSGDWKWQKYWSDKKLPYKIYAGVSWKKL